MNNQEHKPILSGLGASSGVAQGKIKIVSAGDASNFQKGDILVTEMTDPSMVIMMARAAAIITDTGGLTSHAAIVSREMGVPCVVATKTATKDLKDGQEVMIDGDKGKVYLVS